MDNWFSNYVWMYCNCCRIRKLKSFSSYLWHCDKYLWHCDKCGRPVSMVRSRRATILKLVHTRKVIDAFCDHFVDSNINDDVHLDLNFGEITLCA